MDAQVVDALEGREVGTVTACLRVVGLCQLQRGGGANGLQHLQSISQRGAAGLVPLALGLEAALGLPSAPVHPEQLLAPFGMLLAEVVVGLGKVLLERVDGSLHAKGCFVPMLELILQLALDALELVRILCHVGRHIQALPWLSVSHFHISTCEGGSQGWGLQQE